MPAATSWRRCSASSFPTVQFQGASVEEAVEFLRIKSKDLDTMERDPTKRGVNIILRAGAAPSTAQITLELRDVPMVEALRYITELAGMKYKVEPYAVLVVPLSDVGNEQYTRTFKVPPDFLTGGAGDGGGGAAAAATPAAPPDPFAARPAPKPAAGGGAHLAHQGFRDRNSQVPTASPSPKVPRRRSSPRPPSSSSATRSRTWMPVEAFVDSLLKKIPQMITISAKFVEVSQKNTDELGFDWLIGQFNWPGSNGVFGSGGTAGNSANRSGRDDHQLPIPGLPGTQIPIGQFPLTAGNRTGTSAITPDSIDGQLSGRRQPVGAHRPGRLQPSPASSRIRSSKWSSARSARRRAWTS